MKNFLLLFIFVSLFLNSTLATAQSPVEIPKTFEEAKEMGERGVTAFIKEFPSIAKKTWENEVFPVWQKMYDSFSNWWNNTISPWLKNIWHNITSFLGREVEKRKPYLEEEFQKEKEEIKEEAPEVGKSLWERFKEIIK